MRDFTKPAYKIDVIPSKKAILIGDDMEFAIKSSFFEGSPVPNVELNYSGSASGSLTTDANGQASVPYVGSIVKPDEMYGPYRVRFPQRRPRPSRGGRDQQAALRSRYSPRL